MYIPQLGKYAESILENGSISGRKLAKLQRIARQAVAALCALGGFKETIKIGSEVQVTSHHFPKSSLSRVYKSIDSSISWKTNIILPVGQKFLFFQAKKQVASHPHSAADYSVISTVLHSS